MKRIMADDDSMINLPGQDCSAEGHRGTTYVSCLNLEIA